MASTTLYQYSVTKRPCAVFQVNGTPITVPTFDYPSSAGQPGTSRTIDTSDTRLTQAVSAIDSRFGRVAIWTQHTVASGLTAGVRWYEIDPTNGVLSQTGLVTLAGGWAFNGAIAPTLGQRHGQALRQQHGADLRQYPRAVPGHQGSVQARYRGHLSGHRRQGVDRRGR